MATEKELEEGGRREERETKETYQKRLQRDTEITCTKNGPLKSFQNLTPQGKPFLKPNRIEKELPFTCFPWQKKLCVFLRDERKQYLYSANAPASLDSLWCLTHLYQQLNGRDLYSELSLSLMWTTEMRPPLYSGHFNNMSQSMLLSANSSLEWGHLFNQDTLTGKSTHHYHLPSLN